jgi:hypothetical protein
MAVGRLHEMWLGQLVPYYCFGQQPAKDAGPTRRRSTSLRRGVEQNRNWKRQADPGGVTTRVVRSCTESVNEAATGARTRGPRSRSWISRPSDVPIPASLRHPRQGPVFRRHRQAIDGGKPSESALIIGTHFRNYSRGDYGAATLAQRRPMGRPAECAD